MLAASASRHSYLGFSELFVEQFKDVWASLVTSHQVFPSNLDLLQIIRSHLLFFLSTADASQWEPRPPRIAQIPRNLRRISHPGLTKGGRPQVSVEAIACPP